MGTPSPDRRLPCGLVFFFRKHSLVLLLLGGLHPPGAAHTPCFALCFSLYHSLLQTLDAHGAIRRPASVPLPRRPVSVVCSFLKVVARNRRSKNLKHCARRYYTESLNSYIVFTVFPAKAGIHTP